MSRRMFLEIGGGAHGPQKNKNNPNTGQSYVTPTFKFGSEVYDENDPRFKHNILKGALNNPTSLTNVASGTANDTNEWYTLKYRFDTKPIAPGSTDMNAPVLRYADILLIRAEAGASTVVNDEDQARAAVNLVLTRARGAGTAPVNVDGILTGDELREYIFWERARELCFEGHSRFDIVRAGVEKFITEVKNQEKSSDVTDESNTEIVDWSNNVQEKHILMPIPQTEIQSNFKIDKNNPGY